jgi:hypothetical protein
VVTQDRGLSNVSIHLVRSAAISGTVRDQYGNPIAGIAVSALRWAYSGTPNDRGVRRLRAIQGVTAAFSDTKGSYRVFNLPPGDYVMSVPGREVTSEVESQIATTAEDVRRAEQILAGRPDPGPTGRAPASVVFAQTFHPGTPMVDRAVTVRVNAGDERSGVDIVIKPETTLTLTGMISDPAGGTPSKAPSIWLRTADQSLGGRPLFGRYAGNGNFDVPRVLPGSYVLFARANLGGQAASGSTHWSRADVSVSSFGEPVALSLSWRPTVSVAGRLEFEGDAGGPLRSATGLTVSFVEYGETTLVDLPGGKSSADGTFVVSGVTPSRYRIAVAPPAGWILKSIRGAGETDLADAPLIVPEDGVASPLVVTFTMSTTALSGALQDATGRPAPAYTVIVFSQDRNYWTPHTRRVAAARPGTDGSFQFSGLPAGEYLLAAVTNVEENQWFNPEFLASLLPGALRVTIGEGAKVVQNIRIAR